MHLGGQLVVVQVLVSLPPGWETQNELCLRVCLPYKYNKCTQFKGRAQAGAEGPAVSDARNLLGDQSEMHKASDILGLHFHLCFFSMSFRFTSHFLC